MKSKMNMKRIPVLTQIAFILVFSLLVGTVFSLPAFGESKVTPEGGEQRKHVSLSADEARAWNDHELLEMMKSSGTSRKEAIQHLFNGEYRPDVLRFAVSLLIEARDPEEKELILKLLLTSPFHPERFSPDWYVYVDQFIEAEQKEDLLILASQVAARWKEHRLVPALNRHAAHPEMKVRFSIFDSMAAIRSDFIIPTLLRLSESESPRDRLIALEGMERYNDSRLKRALIDLLNDPNKSVRIFAIHTMHRHPDSHEFDMVVARAMRNEEDPEVRRVIVETLGKEPWNGPTGTLHQAIVEDPDPLVRRQAIDSAIRLKDYRSARFISQRLTHEVHPEVKKIGLQAIMILGGSGVHDGLSHIIESEPDPEIRLQAVIASGYLKEYGTIRSLASALSLDPSSSVRMEAAYALGRLEKDYAISFLKEAITRVNEDYEVRAAALTAYLNIKKTDGLLALSAIGDSPEERPLKSQIRLILEHESP